MPKLEPKLVQRELDQGQIWPVYWLYGTETMKSRELLKRIRRAVLGDAAPSGFAASFGEELLDGTEVTGDTVVEAAQSPALGQIGSARLVVVRDAHAMKNPEALTGLLTARDSLQNLTSVCVFLSKDLDGRKKFSKLLTEKAAVVPCEEVAENEREAWVGYLSKRHGVTLAPHLVAQLCVMDPWSLDIVERELEKYTIAGGSVHGAEVLAGEVSLQGGADAFLKCFFERDLKESLVRAEAFADQPDEALPLLGLLAWNVRHLALLIADRESGTRTVKLNPYVAERMAVWARKWSLAEMTELQSMLAELDYGFKQTPLLPLGLWSSIVTRFC